MSWFTIELIGNQFVIPRICPNCLVPGDKPWGATHVKPGYGRSTHYSMTFYYCDACDQMFRAKNAMKKKGWSDSAKLMGVWIGALVVTLLLGVAPAVLLENGFWLLLGGVAGIAFAWYFRRRLAPTRDALPEEGAPQRPPNAVGEGFAAYLIETSGGAFSQKTATFSAARREWLDLLVEANAGSQT